jgi:glycosyltransferase involved in cell wall biosynthesis
VDSDRFVLADRAAARERLGLPQHRLILLAVGALIEDKGHRRVIEILPELIARRPDIVYVAIGAEPHGGGHRELLETLVRQRQLQRHVMILGARPHEEIARWMAAADLFCLATRSEGWCNAITEALACGVPVVTTAVGGNPEVVAAGEDGVLVPFWDAPAFATAVLQALETPWDRPAISARARARGWERTADAVVEEFVRALGMPPAPLALGLGQVQNR